MAKSSDQHSNNSLPGASGKEDLEHTFSGLWQRDQLNENIVHTVDAYRPPQKEIGVSKPKRKGWGVGSFLLTFGVFLASQVIIAVPLMGAFLDSTTASGEGVSEQLTGLLTNPIFIIVSAFSMYIIWVAGMWVTTFFRGQKSFKLDFKLQFKKWDFFIGLGIAILLLCLVAFCSWLVSDVLQLNMEGSDNGSFLLAQEGIWLAILAVGFATIAGPFFEEIFFRGFALHAVLNSATSERELANKLSPNSIYAKWTNFWYKVRYVSAVLFSSVVFGFMHFQGSETFGQWFVVIVTGLLGVVLGITTIRFKRLGPAIFAHMLYNGATLLLALVTSGT